MCNDYKFNRNIVDKVMYTMFKLYILLKRDNITVSPIRPMSMNIPSSIGF